MSDKTAELELIFNLLQQNDISYLVLRGFDEIPEKVSYTNDLDLLCAIEDKDKLARLFKQSGYRIYQDSLFHHTYLYAALPHQHFRCKKKDLHIDIVYNLAYKSPNKGEWVSIHENLQQSIWQNKRQVDKFWLFQPSYHDELIHLICHCIFDKREFKAKYIQRIGYLFAKVNQIQLKNDLELIFFKYTHSLTEQIKEKNYKHIIHNYLAFKEY
ncbi:MAG: nucleotidyltransferase family protein [gamma proteobacterium symbiont of Taylorina sp.]|nr:nucleotidyltransferase family protein [gamma proteobacterium symbiont of Taylorina sp.]